MSNLMIYKLKSTIKNRIRVIMNSDGDSKWITIQVNFKIVSNNYADKGLFNQILELLQSHSCYIPIELDVLITTLEPIEGVVALPDAFVSV